MQKDEAMLLAAKILIPTGLVVSVILYGLSNGESQINNVNTETDNRHTKSPLEGVEGLATGVGLREPYVDGWGMVSNFIVNGSEFECYGVGSDDLGDSGDPMSIYELMKEKYYSGLSEWAIEDYLVIHSDGTYTVKDWYKKYEAAEASKTYCVNNAMRK